MELELRPVSQSVVQQQHRNTLDVACVAQGPHVNRLQAHRNDDFSDSRFRFATVSGQRNGNRAAGRFRIHHSAPAKRIECLYDICAGCCSLDDLRVGTIDLDAQPAIIPKDQGVRLLRRGRPFLSHQNPITIDVISAGENARNSLLLTLPSFRSCR
jgi:hypothetical protein